VITNRPERLKSVDYTGFNRYFLTTCTSRRRPIFVSSNIVDSVRSQLERSASSHAFSIPAYVFMPDHLHALLKAEAENADFRQCIRHFKQVSAFQYKRNHGDSLWQPGYYERILRDDEETLAVTRYIWENPIRAGLTRQLGEYPHCGSDSYQLSDLVDAWWEKRT
jgi:REP element-mobilizing transposase RayT